MSNASIGQVGGKPYVDKKNDRVKGFGDELQTSIDIIEATLRRALQSLNGESRFTMRVPVAHDMDLDRVREIRVNGGSVRVTCEAIVPINNDQVGAIAYFGGNRPERQTAYMTHVAEQACLNQAFAHEMREHTLPDVCVIECHAPGEGNWSDEDVEALVRIYEQAFSGYLVAFTHESVRGMLDGNLVAVVRHNGEIVSVVMAEIAELKTAGEVLRLAEISEVATSPQYHRRGFARMLYGVIVEHLRRAQIEVIFTEARANSVGIMVAARSAGLKPRGLLDQHCVISSEFTDVSQDTEHGSLFVFSL
ncbi:hypothetical protein C0581_01630 [Candidatus Parcubacteria bacterium]|nr:MAG: hypothetical protein C0581_01630 [Candidatus Parcubacteria bacterium]